MDKLFKLVFNNNFIRKYIFKLITIHNKECRYIRYNYYDVPFEIILKSRNEQLLNEKLSYYIKYFKSSNNEDEEAAVSKEDNQDDFMKFNNYYLLFNKSSLIELLNWKELPNQTFELIFKIFENEIKSIVFENGFQIGSKNQLLFDGCLNKLKYLISNKWITNINQFLNYQFSNFYNFKDFKDFTIISNNTIENFKYLFKQVISLSYENNNNINIESIHYLLITLCFIVKYSQISESDKLILNDINKFKELIILQLLPTTTNELLIPQNQDALKELFNEIIKNNDLYTLKLFLKKFEKSNNKSTSKTALLYGYNIPIEIIKSININIIIVFSSLLFELVEFFVINFPEILLDSNNFINIYSDNIINSTDVVLYLNEKASSSSVLSNFTISKYCHLKLIEMGKREELSIKTHLTWNYVPNQIIDHSLCLDISLFDESGLSILLFYVIVNDDFEMLKRYSYVLINQLSIYYIKLLFKRNNQKMIDYILEYLKKTFTNSLDQLPTRMKPISVLLQILIELNKKDYFDFILSIIDKETNLEMVILNSPISNTKYWIIENWSLARKWLNNSISKLINNEYKNLVDIILFGALSLSSLYSTNMKNLTISSSKIIISELISRDPIKEPLSKQLLDNLNKIPITTIRNNIIVMGLLIGITFLNDNNEIQFFEFNKFSNSGNKFINSLYIDKGLIKNLFQQFYNNNNKNSNSNNFKKYYDTHSVLINIDELFLIKNYLLKLMIIQDNGSGGILNIFKHIDEIIKISINKNNKTIINFILSSSNKFKKLNIFNSLLNFKFNQIKETTTSNFQNKNQYYNWIHYLIFKNSTKDNQKVITNLVKQGYLYQQQQPTNDLFKLKITPRLDTEINIKFLENVGLINNQHTTPQKNN